MSLALIERGAKNATPLVLIHAFPLNKDMWRHQIDKLSERFRVIALDMPGFGKSPRLPQGTTPSMKTFARMIKSTLDERSISSAIFGGCSLGGYVCFEIWRSYPSCVRGLVLCDTRAEPDNEETKEKRQTNIGLLHSTQSAAFLANSMLPNMISKKTTDASLQQWLHDTISSCSPQGVEDALIALMNREDSTSTLATIECPTLVVVGEDDVLTPVSISRAMHALLPKSRLEVIPNAGHLSPLEQPDAFNKAVVEYFGQCPQ